MIQYMQNKISDISYKCAEGHKLHNHLNRCRKGLSITSTSLHDKRTEKTGNIRNISLHNKGYI